VTVERHDLAVALCCDRNYFHLALFMIRQVAFHNPNRTFDFVISSQDDLELPDWSKSLGIILHRAGDLSVRIEAPRFRGSVAPLLRLMLARELGDRYRRIIYLDCDMIVEGGDFNRLAEVDLGPHPIAAVLDAPFLSNDQYLAREFARLGWPAMPYANSGLQVIDTQAYREQDVEKRCMAVGRDHQQAIVFTDQSLMNIALKGRFARLAPCWNWQWDISHPLLSLKYPVFVHHFIGGQKPDRKGAELLDLRFNQAYRTFMEQFMPDRLAQLALPGPLPPMTLRQVAGMAYSHLTTRRRAEAFLARFPDPYRTTL
jgi:lipopolysaccharide biosynthesis glycosyltransferase